MKKIDYKKDFKHLYGTQDVPVIIDVPAVRYVVIDGKGDPNGEAFAMATMALYSFSYALKMSYKSKNIPMDYYEYTVFPLEGVWDLVDKTKAVTDKSNYAYSIMITQPDFLTDELFQRILQEIKNKKPNPWLDHLRMEISTEGLCCQMLHYGSYDNEPASFAKMEQFCLNNGYQRTTKLHREIYLSDPRKTQPEKLRTILRFKVEKVM
jgi:hypothetical protein